MHVGCLVKLAEFRLVGQPSPYNQPNQDILNHRNIDLYTSLLQNLHNDYQ